MKDYVECYQSNRYDVYNLSEVDGTGSEFSSPGAIQGVLDFISGLKQTRAEVQQSVDERMADSEQEVVTALAVQFEENMRIDEADLCEDEEESKTT